MKQNDPVNGHSRIEQEIYMLLEKHVSDFKKHVVDWQEHRRQAIVAMDKVKSMEAGMTQILPAVVHLAHLPTIANSLLAIENGLLKQNQTLAGQNSDLIRPHTKSSSTLGTLAMMMIMLLCAVVFLLIMKSVSTDFKVFGENGIHIKSNEKDK